MESRPPVSLLSDRSAFFNFLQRAWPRFLVKRETAMSASQLSFNRLAESGGVHICDATTRRKK